MKKIFYNVMALTLLVSLAAGCGKAAPAEDENAWVHDENLRVPVLFGSAASVDAVTKVIKYGPVTGSVMNTLDVGIVSVAEKESDATPVTWSTELDGSVLIDNLGVTTTSTGAVVFSPKIYYPFGNKYAYSFYSYYPYTNSDGETASVQDGAYKITYDLGNTDILWASAVAEDYEGTPGYNAAYCRAVKLAGVDSQYYPKFQYSHLLTALVFRVVGKDSDIENYDVKVTGMQLTGTSSQATLCIADSNGELTGKLTGNEDGGSIGFTELDAAPTPTETELCTILAMPSRNYTAAVTLTVDGANKSTVEIPLGSTDGRTTYEAGYIYYFTVTVNNPQEVTIVGTVLEEWVPGTNPTPGEEV